MALSERWLMIQLAHFELLRIQLKVSKKKLMNKLKHYVKRVLETPPQQLPTKFFGVIKRKITAKYRHNRDTRKPTYLSTTIAADLQGYLTNPPRDKLEPAKDDIIALADLYCQHYFDLLGSGWVQVKHGMQCRGVEGHRYDIDDTLQPDDDGHWLKDRINSPNLPYAQRVWRLIDKDYVPIDWQRDFKCGYRWSEKVISTQAKYGHQLGMDIKVPWELARAQHFPMMAYAFALTGDSKYVQEFRNGVLDFIATNPPRYGANWICTMDVSIRISNWLLAYDLLKGYEATFDDKFEAEFKRGVYQHGKHIISNLEWSAELRSNHYLSNVVGLLFVAAYLPSTPEVDAWLAFAVQELIVEVKAQFGEDGANFEASTNYHRLSAEMVIYGTALVLGLQEEKSSALRSYDYRLHQGLSMLRPAPMPLYEMGDQKIPFPAWYIERLEKMAEFTIHIIKPNGKVPQFGDNDSGRFLKIQPNFQRLMVAEAKQKYANLEGYDDLPDEAIYWDEDILDHRHLVAAINALFGRRDFADFVGEGFWEGDVVVDLANGVRLPSYLKGGMSTAQEKTIGDRLPILEDNLVQHTLEIPVQGGNLHDDLVRFAYRDFGLYLFRSKRLYLAVRCGSVGQNGNGGHAHNDQLSIELTIDGENYVVDPGTYLYTPLPKRRDEYRSIKAHFSPQMGDVETGDLSVGSFAMRDKAKAKCLYFGEDGFAGVHQGFGQSTYRMIRIKNDVIMIDDYGAENLTLVPQIMPVSNGYGKLLTDQKNMNETIIQLVGR